MLILYGFLLWVLCFGLSVVALVLAPDRYQNRVLGLCINCSSIRALAVFVMMGAIAQIAWVWICFFS